MQPLLGKRSADRRGMGTLAALAGLLGIGCILVVGLVRSSHRNVELFGKDAFIQSYMGEDKQLLLGRQKKTDFWRNEVEHGGLMKRLHNMETSKVKAHKQWKQQQLSSLIVPDGGSKNMLKDLDIIESRAEHAPDAHDALSNLEKTVQGETGEDVARGGKWSANLAQWRKHADSVGPKYATNKKHPALQKEIPSFDNHVNSLMHSLGEARHAPADAAPQHPHHLAAAPSSSQQLSQASSSSPLSIPDSVLREIRETKAAAARSERASAARRAAAAVKGAKRAAAVQDQFSMPMRDATEPSRQSANRVVRAFV